MYCIWVDSIAQLQAANLADASGDGLGTDLPLGSIAFVYTEGTPLTMYSLVNIRLVFDENLPYRVKGPEVTPESGYPEWRLMDLGMGFSVAELQADNNVINGGCRNWYATKEVQQRLFGFYQGASNTSVLSALALCPQMTKSYDVTRELIELHNTTENEWTEEVDANLDWFSTGVTVGGEGSVVEELFVVKKTSGTIPTTRDSTRVGLVTGYGIAIPSVPTMYANQLLVQSYKPSASGALASCGSATCTNGLWGGTMLPANCVSSYDGHLFFGYPNYTGTKTSQGRILHFLINQTTGSPSYVGVIEAPVPARNGNVGAKLGVMTADIGSGMETFVLACDAFTGGDIYAIDASGTLAGSVSLSRNDYVVSFCYKNNADCDGFTIIVWFDDSIAGGKILHGVLELTSSGLTLIGPTSYLIIPTYDDSIKQVYSNNSVYLTYQDRHTIKRLNKTSSGLSVETIAMNPNWNISNRCGTTNWNYARYGIDTGDDTTASTFKVVCMAYDNNDHLSMQVHEISTVSNTITYILGQADPCITDTEDGYMQENYFLSGTLAGVDDNICSIYFSYNYPSSTTFWVGRFVIELVEVGGGITLDEAAYYFSSDTSLSRLPLGTDLSGVEFIGAVTGIPAGTFIYFAISLDNGTTWITSVNGIARATLTSLADIKTEGGIIGYMDELIAMLSTAELLAATNNEMIFAFCLERTASAAAESNPYLRRLTFDISASVPDIWWNNNYWGVQKTRWWLPAYYIISEPTNGKQHFLFYSDLK